MSNPHVHPSPSLTAHITKYRADVDGLRAIAILSVIAFHAFPNLVPGGFVGVDVFFVISGFLISSVIVEHLQAGTFSFVGFFQRRVRRIFPALCVVLVSCAVAGWYLLSAGDYAQLGKHIAGGAGFVANLVLWKEAGYFDAHVGHQAAAAPVEPRHRGAVLLRLAGRRCGSPGACAGTCWSSPWLVLLASFAANLVMVRTDAVANFYLPTTRIWELLIGAALAGVASTEAVGSPSRAKVATPLAAGGLAAMLLAEVLLTKDTLFPGWWALLPTLGAAALIAAGPDAAVNRRFLSHPAMVWIGLISYPLVPVALADPRLPAHHRRVQERARDRPVRDRRVVRAVVADVPLHRAAVPRCAPAQPAQPRRAASTRDWSAEPSRPSGWWPS